MGSRLRGVIAWWVRNSGELSNGHSRRHPAWGVIGEEAQDLRKRWRYSGQRFCGNLIRMMANVECSRSARPTDSPKRRSRVSRQSTRLRRQPLRVDHWTAPSIPCRRQFHKQVQIWLGHRLSGHPCWHQACWHQAATWKDSVNSDTTCRTSDRAPGVKTCYRLR
jgi:hypothetical protein